MFNSQSLPWADPLDLAAQIDEPYWVLLYSGVQESYSGRYSYLACQMDKHIESEDFNALEAVLTNDTAADASHAQAHHFENLWFGTLGYELKHCLEEFPEGKDGYITVPPLCMMHFHCVYQFDHTLKRLTLWSDLANPSILTPKSRPSAYIVPEITQLQSSMSEAEYLQHVALIIDKIKAGDLYQANLTRKFMGEFCQTPDYFQIFQRLCQVSPAPYSAFLRLNDRYILSSSPELFLRSDANGALETRPIKGTSPRYSDKQEDDASRAALLASHKDRAENLMITDLMRNDLSRSCNAGSIDVKELFEVTSHATIHHMSSTVSGQRSHNASLLDSIKSCFPPGSMTGAPKIKAIYICNELEQMQRGVYSGALGWVNSDGSCELSVVIRTLVMYRHQLEFQVGGAIVADSTPQNELLETFYKARGMLAALGIDNPLCLRSSYAHNA